MARRVLLCCMTMTQDSGQAEMVEALVRMAQSAVVCGAEQTARVLVKWLAVYGRGVTSCS